MSFLSKATSVVALFLMGTLCAQTIPLESEVSAIRAAYASLNAFSFNVKYISHFGEKTDTIQGSVIQSGESLYQYIDNAESVLTPFVGFMVDHQSRQMSFSYCSDVAVETHIKKEPISISDFLNMVDGASISEIGNGTRMLSIQKNEGDVRSVKLYYSTSTHFITKLEIAQASVTIKDANGQDQTIVPLVTVFIDAFKANPQVSENTFSWKKYVQPTGDTVEPTSAYAGYGVLGDYKCLKP